MHGFKVYYYDKKQRAAIERRFTKICEKYNPDNYNYLWFRVIFPSYMVSKEFDAEHPEGGCYHVDFTSEGLKIADTLIEEFKNKMRFELVIEIKE